MRNNEFIYIKVDEKSNSARMFGITFREFIDSVKIKPKNYLILEGDVMNSNIDLNLELEYVENENIEEFLKEEVYDYGDFSWIDYENKESLDKISKLDLAKLLYFKHKKEVFDTSVFEVLNNNYIYYTHDDGWDSKVYFKDINEVKNLINKRIVSEIKGRKKSISNLESEILNKVYSLAKDGVVIDLENKTTDSITTYAVGDLKSIDKVHSKLDKMRKCLRGISLIYNTRKKYWYIE